MNTFDFSCDVENTSQIHSLYLKILLNDKVMFDDKITDPKTISFNIDDSENNWHMQFIISGKTDLHTVVDDQGNIQSSAELVFKNFSFDEISIDNIIALNPLPYTHDYNGHGDTIVDRFYNTAGCNGIIDLKFSTPIYLWLLENM
jgi:hypothetical protein